MEQIKFHKYCLIAVIYYAFKKMGVELAVGHKMTYHYISNYILRHLISGLENLWVLSIMITEKPLNCKHEAVDIMTL